MLEFLSKKKSNKVIDSSVLIDGRILGVFESGFLEPEGIIIPLFILEEIQRLADSKDHDKREKGKRGLAVARKLQELTEASIWNKRIKEIDEENLVDSKVVLLAKHLDAKILTLDNSLFEIAKIHKIPVLSIHQLYMSVRPRLMVGDVIWVKIRERGREAGQGRADYEGIMVVVDGGEAFLRQRVQVEIRGVQNNDIGYLAFARPVKKEEDGGI